MAISDRIAVMKDGTIQHVGTPKQIYQRPANLFVSNFIGRSNALDARLTLSGGAVSLAFPSGYAMPYDNLKEPPASDMPVKVAVRPEEFVLAQGGEGIGGVIQSSVFLGLNTTYFVDLPGGASAEIVEESSIASIIPDGTKIALTLKADKINVFTEDGSRNLTSGGDGR